MKKLLRWGSRYKYKHKERQVDRVRKQIRNGKTKVRRNRGKKENKIRRAHPMNNQFVGP